LQAQAFEKLTIAVWCGMTELHLNLEMINAAGVVNPTRCFSTEGACRCWKNMEKLEPVKGLTY
jgi:hypothetical protein